MDILPTLGAIIAAVGGIYITIHEVRRRERRVTRKEINELVEEIHTLRDRGELNELFEEVAALRRLLLEQRRYIYKLVILMTDAGLNPPQPPAPSFDPGEYENEEIDND